jgi:hypothetical protein
MVDIFEETQKFVCVHLVPLKHIIINVVPNIILRVKLVALERILVLHSDIVD